MEQTVGKEEVWAASIEDRPGGLAEKLEALAEAGADLEFIIARRSTDRPGTGVLFVTPLQGDREVRAATNAGFSITTRMHSVRVEANNVPGLTAKLTRLLADDGLNLRGLSAAVTGGSQAVFHLAFDTERDAAKAMQLLQRSI